MRVLQPADTRVPTEASPLLLSAAGIGMAVPGALYLLGFTKTGIAAGSLAAKMMSLSAISNGGHVAAGSLVAIAQSLGEWSQSGAAGSTGHHRAPHVSVSLGGISSEEGAWGGHGSRDPRGPTRPGVPGVAPQGGAGGKLLLLGVLPRAMGHMRGLGTLRLISAPFPQG